MKPLFLLGLLATLLRPVATTAQALPPDLLLDETFQDNRRGWFTGDNATWRVALANGEYQLDNRQAGGHLSWQPLTLNSAQDFAIEVDLRASTGGLVWGGTPDAANLNLVGLLPGQKLAVGRWRAGQWQWVSPAGGVTAPALRDNEWNTLRLVRQGGTVRYFANNQEVFSHAFEPLPGNLTGFQLEAAPATLRVRRLRAWHHSGIRLVAGLPPGLQRERLGPQLNSPDHHEGAPVLSPDGQELYFGHRPPVVPGQPQRCDIWLSRRQPDGGWGPAEDLGRPLNNGSYSCPMGITPDGQTMLVLNHYQPDGSPAPSGGCSLARRQPNGRWGVPEPVLIPGLPAKPSYYYFNLAADGLTIVLAFGDEAQPGSGDLYVSRRSPDGQWSRPQSLGPVVNSPGQENSPFLAPDGKTLYFASNGHPGYGDADLFVSRRLDDSWTNWSAPLNLGPGINSAGSDACYTLGAAGDYAYLCSQQWPEPLEDLFRVKLPADAQPTPTQLVRGRVLNALTQDPIAGADIFYERLPDGAIAGAAHAAGGTGRYQLVLPSGGAYGFRAIAPGYVSINENVDLTAATAYTEVTKDLLLMPLAVPVASLTVVPLAATGTSPTIPGQVRGIATPVKEEKIALNNVFFVQGQPTLLPGSYPELTRLAQTLKANPDLRIRLEGHTDNVGGAAENQALSEKRVAAIKAYLMKRGVDEARLATAGFGGSRPVAPNDTEEHKRKNRRVEFVILNQ